MGLNKYTSYSSGESIPLLRREDGESGLSLFKTELYWIAKKSLPIVSTHLLHSTLQLITVYTGGHLNTIDLSALGIGNMIASLSCWSITYGIVSALETFSSQSWTGSKDKTLLGIYLQRGIVILTILLIPVSILWWNCEIVLIWLGQDPEVSARVSIYLRYLLIGAPAYIYFDATKKYVQAQGIMHVSTIAIGISIPIYAVLNYVLVYVEPFKLGFIGIPISISITYWLMLSIMVCYIRFVEGYSAWGGFSLECFKGLGTFMRLALPSIFSIASEWWACNLSNIAVSYSGIENIAAQYILVTLEKGLISIPMGIGTAGSNRIGNNLGEESARRARFSYFATMFLCATLGIATSILVTLFKQPISRFFTTDKDVDILLENTMGLIALAFILDSTNVGCRFVITGLGRQIVTAISSTVAFYLFGMPICYYICVKLHKGVIGFWTLYIGVLSMVVLVNNLYLWIVDWNSETERVKIRVRKEESVIKSDTPNDPYGRD
ncbi:MATE efflux family protein [Backusella circina FSU 941]|nr:MATE efflux family protein [Backusella circina FSU 941]